jgi:cytochrome c6
MKRTIIRTQLTVLVIAAFVNLSAVSSWAQSPTETLFKSKCAICHGADGKGEVPAGQKLGARNLKSPEVQSQSDTQLTAVLTKGQNKMPAYGSKLSGDQITGLIKYIRSLK